MDPSCQRGQSHDTYLDDFLVLGAPNLPECADALDLAITLHTCAELGVPLASDKIEGPTTSLRFLEIQLDSTFLSLSLPGDCLGELRGMLVGGLVESVFETYCTCVLGLLACADYMGMVCVCAVHD